MSLLRSKQLMLSRVMLQLLIKLQQPRLLPKLRHLNHLAQRLCIQGQPVLHSHPTCFLIAWFLFKCKLYNQDSSLVHLWHCNSLLRQQLTFSKINLKFKQRASMLDNLHLVHPHIHIHRGQSLLQVLSL